MLVPTSNILLQNIEKYNKDKNLKNNNTVKIDFRKMASFPSSEKPFTQCEFCQGVVVSKNE